MYIFHATKTVERFLWSQPVMSQDKFYCWTFTNMQLQESSRGFKIRHDLYQTGLTL